jgi:sulfoxide reductase heme-binding subunit YedZ
MRKSWLKIAVVLGCLAPLVWLAWRWHYYGLGINNIEYVARFTGRWALRFFLVTLALTPLRRIPGLNFLGTLRRTFGLITFFYATLHGFHYFQRDAQWEWSVLKDDLTIRRFFIAGAAAWLLMLPLAVTSTDGAIRRMGKRWRTLHRLAYLSVFVACIHYLWQAKGINLTPLMYLGILLLLMASRIVIWVSKRASTLAR